VAGPQQATQSTSPPLLARVLGWLGAQVGDAGHRPVVDETDWQSSFEEECRCPGPCNRDHENE
jgi:hypothetical protein